MIFCAKDRASIEQMTVAWLDLPDSCIWKHLAFLFVEDVRTDTKVDSQGGNLLLLPLNNTMLLLYCSPLPTGKY